MRKLPAPSASDTLRVHAVARLMLDNIPHVKAFWIATGVEVAQVSLWYGVDDLDGTVQEERIYHMAGARTPVILTTADIRRLIRAAGRVPVERDTLYNVITPPAEDARPEVAAGDPVDLIAVDRALEALAKAHPEYARVVELRFFGGLSVDEAADVLDLSPATVKRHWTFAKAWLLRAIQGGSA